MAAMSLRLTAIAFQPRSLRVVSERSASMPATTVSVASRTRRRPRRRPQDGGVVAEPDLPLGGGGQGRRKRASASCSPRAGPSAAVAAIAWDRTH